MTTQFTDFRRYVTAAKALFLLIALSLFVLAGCDTTDPHDDEDDHGHAEPVGFVLQIEGETLVSVLNNRDIEWNPDGALNDWFQDGITGLVLSPDVVSMTDSDPTGLSHEIALKWVDDQGDLFDLDNHDEEYTIEWEWEKPNSLETTCSEANRTDPSSLDQLRPGNLLSVEEDHDHVDDDHAHEELEVQFRADHAGSDRVRFLIMHSGHADFTTAWIPVTVADDDHPRIDENGIYQHSSDRCVTH